MEAAVLGVNLFPRPILQLHHQLVVTLLAEAVDVVQSQPVFAVYVSKTPLTKETLRGTNVITLKLRLTLGSAEMMRLFTLRCANLNPNRRTRNGETMK